MRVFKISLVAAAAAALVACGGDDDPNDPGAGGTAGSDQTGGTGGSSACAGLRVIEAESATSVVVRDRTDTVNNWVGSCTVEDDPGNDVVVHFVFPEAGHYHFSTAGSDVDTLVYALEDCMNGFTELKCNDTYFDEHGAFTLLDREAGDDIYVVVDTVEVRESREFVLTITKVDEPAPPVVETFEAYFNPDSKFTGVRLEGKAEDAPLIAYGLQVYSPQGQALSEKPIVLAFDDPDYPLLAVTHQDGNFRIEGAFALGDPPVAIGAVELAFVDANELATPWEKRTTEAPPTLARGDRCDPAGALGVCPAGDICQAPAGSEERICSPGN